MSVEICFNIISSAFFSVLLELNFWLYFSFLPSELLLVWCASFPSSPPHISVNILCAKRHSHVFRPRFSHNVFNYTHSPGQNCDKENNLDIFVTLGDIVWRRTVLVCGISSGSFTPFLNDSVTQDTKNSWLVYGDTTAIV